MTSFQPCKTRDVTLKGTLNVLLMHQAKKTKKQHC